MNTTEKIVDVYYRVCQNCFTMSDVKVIKGNNRQIDLLAYHLKDNKQYHIEVSVTHCQNWCPTFDELKKSFEKKFFGVPPVRDGKNTDHMKGKNYLNNIFDTYKSVGFDSENIKRIWVCWTVKDDKEITEYLKVYSNERGLINNPIQILSFRDRIIPTLMQKIETSNYDDDTLRTLSLLQQYQNQI